MLLCSHTLSRVTVSSQGMAAMPGMVSSQAMGSRGTVSSQAMGSRGTVSREAMEDSHREIPMEATNPPATLRKVGAAAICALSCAQQTTTAS